MFILDPCVQWKIWQVDIWKTRWWICLCVCCVEEYMTEPMNAPRYSLQCWLLIHMFVRKVVAHHSIEFLPWVLPFPLNGRRHRGRWNVKRWILALLRCRFVPACWDCKAASKCQLCAAVSIWLAYPHHIYSSQVIRINSSESSSQQFFANRFSHYLGSRNELHRLHGLAFPPVTFCFW